MPIKIIQLFYKFLSRNAYFYTTNSYFSMSDPTWLLYSIDQSPIHKFTSIFFDPNCRIFFLHGLNKFAVQCCSILQSESYLVCCYRSSIIRQMSDHLHYISTSSLINACLLVSPPNEYTYLYLILFLQSSSNLITFV